VHENPVRVVPGLAEIRQAEADLKRQAEERARTAEEKTRATSSAARRESSPRRHRATGQKKSGRLKTADSGKTVEEVTGMSERTQRRVERHVAIAEQYPFMQRGSCQCQTVSVKRFDDA